MAPSSDDSNHAKSPEQKPSKLKTAWSKLGLDFMTVAMMFKGSIGPAIAIAIYQSDAVAAQYTTLGYLIAIMSILGFPIMPRGKFIQNMSLHIIAACLGVCTNLLAMWTAVQARYHTTAPGTPAGSYNSSASAVCAIWLIVQIYLVNYLRGARPQFYLPGIVYSIFVSVSLIYGPVLPTTAEVISFELRLLYTFLTGFAIAIAVHFLIFPVTSRTVVCKEFAGYLMSVAGVLKAQSEFMHRIEEVDPVAARQQAEAEEALKKHGKFGHHKTEHNASTSPAAQALNAAVDKIMELHSKINGDIVSAGREFAIGKLSQKDFSAFWRKSRTMLTPLMGLISVLDHLKRFGEEMHLASTDLPEKDLERNKELIQNLRITARSMRGPQDEMVKTLSAGLMHVNITMEFVKPPKQKKADPEEALPADAPGSNGFATSFKQKLQDFETSKQVTLEEWCKEKGVNDPQRFLQGLHIHAKDEGDDDSLADHFQRQLFLMLYLEYLLLRIGQNILDLILFADQLHQEGKFKRKRLIFPGAKVMKKWLWAIFGQEDMTKEDHMMTDMEAGASETVYLGAAFEMKKDPEHLPPQNWRERIGEIIRLCPKFFRSDNSSFAFRVVCATMSIAIIAYLEASQQFFLSQRLLWAMIMVAISMTKTAGQSTFNFVLRIVGTIVAMIGAYIVFYIVDGQTPGVIVMLWFWMFLGQYFTIKYPKFIIIATLGVVTTILIVGYELQVIKLGVAAAESNGQPAYPTYLLAPYRLACVVGGLVIAWIWTIWPYPVSEHSELRKDIGASLYLLANFYSNVHEMVQARLRRTGGHITTKGSHAYLLDKARIKVLGKILALLSQMQTNSNFSKFQVMVGGRFPREEYDGMIACIRRILVSTALIAHASDTLSESSEQNVEESEWSRDFRSVTETIGSTSNRITSTLALLSSSLLSGQPLPPYLEQPKPFAFIRDLEAIDKNILGVRHIDEPEYSAFVVIQLCASSLDLNLLQLKKHVTFLVGEIDFSFRPAYSSTTTSLSSDKSRSGDEKRD